MIIHEFGLLFQTFVAMERVVPFQISILCLHFVYVSVMLAQRTMQVNSNSLDPDSELIKASTDQNVV
jgi:hypothetical protein